MPSQEFQNAFLVRQHLQVMLCYDQSLICSIPDTYFSG